MPESQSGALTTRHNRHNHLAGVVGLEPTLEVLETYILPLNYTPMNKWWLRTESNRRHMDFQSIALPTELLSHI